MNTTYKCPILICKHRCELPFVKIHFFCPRCGKYTSIEELEEWTRKTQE